MATIYLGIDEKLGRRAAVKVLSPDFAERDSSLPLRFEREAQAVGLLDHENIVTIYQYGQEGSFYFLAMRYVEGIDLAELMEEYTNQGKLMPYERAIAILEQVAAALDHAHERGIIHRDIKPSNILLGANDRAYLSDFGLVLRQSVDQTLGTAFGTPRYISPEQATDSQRVVPQSDIYSLAVIVYEIVTGERLFKGNTPMEVALNHITETPLPPRALIPDFPPDAQQVILKSLEKDPKNRHASATAFISELKQALLNPTPAPAQTGLLSEPKATPPKSPSEPSRAGASPKPPTAPSISSRTRTLPPNSTLPIVALRRQQNAFLLTGIGSALVIVLVALAFILGRNNAEGEVTLPTLAPSPTVSPTVQVVAVFTPTNTPAPTFTPTNTPAPTFTPTNTPEPSVPTNTPAPVLDPTESLVTTFDLIYTDSLIALRNLGGLEQRIRTLRFEGATEADSLTNDGERFGTLLQAGECLVIKISGRNIQTPSAWGCGSAREVTLSTPSLFWRADTPEDVVFRVFLNNVLLKECPTVGRAVGRLDETTCSGG
jgi:serine/threonine-protein kinase